MFKPDDRCYRTASECHNIMDHLTVVSQALRGIPMTIGWREVKAIFLEAEAHMVHVAHQLRKIEEEHELN